MSTAGAKRTLQTGHWSKDYVEHLRTVHFALVAISLALVVLSTSWRTTDLVTADGQLRDIVELLRTWKKDWASNVVYEALANTNLPYQIFPLQSSLRLRLDDEDLTQVLGLKFRGVNWTINDEADDIRGAFGGAGYAHVPAILVDASGSLQWFHQFWNTLAKKDLVVKVPTQLGREAIVSIYDEGLGMRRLSAPVVSDSGKVDSDLTMEFMAPGSTMTADVTPESALAHGYYFDLFQPQKDKLPYSIAIPAERFYSVRVDFQSVFINRFRSWKHGSYEYSFRALNDITRDYETLNVDTILKIIESEKARAGDSFEAFGVKFPAEGTTRWGILVVISIQVYFWLHLQELAKKLGPRDEGWEVAWIGVYHSFIAKLVFGLSAFFLPVLAVLSLAVRAAWMGSFPWWKDLLLMLPIVTSGIVAVLAWRRLPTPISKVV